MQSALQSRYIALRANSLFQPIIQDERATGHYFTCWKTYLLVLSPCMKGNARRRRNPWWSIQPSGNYLFTQEVRCCFHPLILETSPENIVIELSCDLFALAFSHPTPKASPVSDRDIRFRLQLESPRTLHTMAWRLTSTLPFHWMMLRSLGVYAVASGSGHCLLRHLTTACRRIIW